MPLNDLRCKNAKPKTKPYKLSDTGGLYLFITPSGGKSWRFKYRYLGKEKTLTIGSYPAIPLQEARKLRDQAKEQLRKGDDPSFEKAEQKRLASYKAAQTFDLIAHEWHNKYLDTWSEEHGKRILYRLNKTILQQIGHYPIDKLTPQLLLTSLQKAESRSPELAITMLHYCSWIFQYAGLTGRLDRDLTFGLKGALKKPKRGHYACIPLEELPAFVKALYAPVSKRRNIPNLAARLLMLTFVRTNEMMRAEWSEFDFGRAIWRIPAARMKMRREHIVPLSRQAIAILMELKALNGHRRYVFASPVNPKKPMAKDVALKELKRVGYGTIMSGHGFRTLAMGVIKEMLGYNHDPVDRQLAHLPKNSIDRAYDRSSFMRQRIPMMQAYADCLDEINNHQITNEKGINVFKLNIISIDNVVCFTERAKLYGKLQIVGEDRFTIELTAKSRTIYLMGKVGHSDYLDGLKIINLSYADTGDSEVKCGLAIIFKKEPNDLDVIPKSCELEELKDLGIDDISRHVKFLENTQHIAIKYD